MLNAAQKRVALIEDLESALGLGNELGDGVIGYLIGRALDEARANRVPSVMLRTNRSGR